MWLCTSALYSTGPDCPAWDVLTGVYPTSTRQYHDIAFTTGQYHDIAFATGQYHDISL